MKIYHLFRNLKFGGCQTQALSIINYMEEDQHYVIYLNEEEKVEDSMIDTFSSCCDNVFYISQVDKRFADVNDEINSIVKKDSVLVSWFYPYSLRLRLSIPVFHHAGTAAGRLGVQWLKNQIIFISSYFRKKSIIYASQHIENSYKDRYFMPPTSKNVIYNGVDVRKFKGESRYLENCNKFLMVGRLDGSKDFDSFVKLAHDIKKMRVEAEFTIVGDGCDRERLERLNYSLGSPVFFKGRVNDMPREYREHGVFLFFNREIEGFGNVIVEAMLSGLLVVSNNLGASKEIIDHGVNGFLMDGYGSYLDLILEVIDGEDIVGIVNNGQDKASLEFSASRSAMRYGEVLRGKI